MAMMQCLAIQTSDPRSVCWAGGNLEGEVTLILTDPTLIRGIRLSYRVEAHVEYMDDGREVETEEEDEEEEAEEGSKGKHGHKKQKKKGLMDRVGAAPPRRRTATEKFLETTSILWGTEPTTSYGEMMPAGHHSLAFDIRVPQHLPGSFEGRYGFIRHWLECIVDRPGSPDMNTKRALSVIALCDLNKDPVATKPLRHSEEVILCCGCVKPDRYEVSYELPYRGYVPGETMFPEFRLRNFTRHPIHVHAKLQMITTYRARTRRKITTRIVAQEKKVMHRAEVTKWEPSLQVPALPPTGLGGCNVIDVRFLFEVELTSHGFGWQGLSFQDEVKIGTMPLQDVTRGRRSQPPLSAKMAVLLGQGYSSSSEANRASSSSTGDGRFTSDADSASPLAHLPRYPKSKRSASIISSSSHWSFNPGPSFLRHPGYQWNLQQDPTRDSQKPKPKSRFTKKQNAPKAIKAGSSKNSTSQFQNPFVYTC